MLTSHYIYRRGLAPGKSSNLSARVQDLVAITPRGVSLRDVREEQIVLVDMDQNVVAGEEAPSSELPMHLEIYQRRPDVHGVVHTHSPYITGFAMVGEKISRLEGFGEIRKPYLAMAEYAPPGTDQLARLVGEILEEEDVVILQEHGLVATGTDLEDAVLMAEFAETSAKTSFVAKTLRSRPDRR